MPREGREPIARPILAALILTCATVTAAFAGARPAFAIESVPGGPVLLVSDPVYPESAKAMGVEGQVTVRVVFDTLGLPDSVQMSKGYGDSPLGSAASAAAATTRLVRRPPTAAVGLLRFDITYDFLTTRTAGSSDSAHARAQHITLRGKEAVVHFSLASETTSVQGSEPPTLAVVPIPSYPLMANLARISCRPTVAIVAAYGGDILATWVTRGSYNSEIDAAALSAARATTFIDHKGEPSKNAMFCEITFQCSVVVRIPGNSQSHHASIRVIDAKIGTEDFPKANTRYNAAKFTRITDVSDTKPAPRPTFLDRRDVGFEMFWSSGQEKSALVSALIDTRGKVRRIEFKESSGEPGYDSIVSRSLKTSVFNPATSRGKPVEAWVRLKYESRYSNECPPPPMRTYRD